MDSTAQALDLVLRLNCSLRRPLARPIIRDER
jgi:hypothetical protein